MNYRGILVKELRHVRWIMIVGLVILLGTALLLVGTFGTASDILHEIPADILDNIRIVRQLAAIYGDYSYYLWSQWVAKNMTQLGAILAIFLAATQFAGEVSKKTIGFLLTRPISRTTVFLGKIITGTFVIMIVFMMSTVFLFVLSRLFGYQAFWLHIGVATIIGLLWLSVFYLIGCLISMYFTEPLPAGVAIGVGYLLLAIPRWVPSLNSLSLYWRMQAVDYFIWGENPWHELVLALPIIGILTAAGLYIFKRRDL